MSDIFSTFVLKPDVPFLPLPYSGAAAKIALRQAKMLAG
jgi:hypothetical protein